MATIAVAAIITAATAVGMGTYSAVEQADARGEQKKLQALQQAKATRQQIAQQRQAAAQIENQGANSGTTNSSGVIGGAGSTYSQMASNLGFITQSGALQDNIDQDIFNMGMARGIGGIVQGVAGAASAFSLGVRQGDAASSQANLIEKNKSIFSNPVNLAG